MGPRPCVASSGAFRHMWQLPLTGDIIPTIRDACQGQSHLKALQGLPEDVHRAEHGQHHLVVGFVVTSVEFFLGGKVID